jgi:hypothetical protein
MATKIQKMNLPVIGVHRVGKGVTVPLKHAPLIDTGRNWREKPSLMQRAALMLERLKSLGAA